MPDTVFPSSWRDPRYVGTIVGVLATGFLYVYRTLTQSGPTTGEIAFVILAIVLPASIAYELARRL
jgi:lysozyme family protein